MSYTALYRKFRPDEFEDVKGQDAIVRTLKNQINADRIGHAYLFCAPLFWLPLYYGSNAGNRQHNTLVLRDFRKT